MNSFLRFTFRFTITLAITNNLYNAVTQHYEKNLSDAAARPRSAIHQQKPFMDHAVPSPSAEMPPSPRPSLADVPPPPLPSRRCNCPLPTAETYRRRLQSLRPRGRARAAAAVCGPGGRPRREGGAAAARRPARRRCSCGRPVPPACAPPPTTWPTASSGRRRPTGERPRGGTESR